MRVEIDKIHKDSYINLAKDVNKIVKGFKSEDYKINKSYESLLLNKDISVEKKKKALIEKLHKLIVKTFSIDLNKIKPEKKILEVLKGNIKIVNSFISKLKDINYHLEENFLAELGLIKKSLSIFKSKSPEKLLEKARFRLSKDYLDKLEHTTYKLIEKIISFDKKLLKNYKSKEEKVIGKERIEVKDLNKILKTQSELLSHLEAKLPPPGKIKIKLLKKSIFNQWVPLIFALLAALEGEHKKESLVFKKLKKNNKIRRLVNKKIKSLEKEKANLISIKQKRLLGMTITGKLEDELRLMHHEFKAVNSL